MILISGLAAGEERTVSIQGQYLYMDTVRVGGALDGAVAVPVTIITESGRRSTYPLRSQDKISFSEGVREITLKNSASAVMDIVLQNGWGDFSPRVELDAGTVTVEPGSAPLVVVPPAGGALDVSVVNPDAAPVPVKIMSGGGSSSVPRRVWAQECDTVTARIDTGDVATVVGVPLVLTPPPVGWRFSSCAAVFSFDSYTGGSAQDQANGVNGMVVAVNSDLAINCVQLATTNYRAGDFDQAGGLVVTTDPCEGNFDALQAVLKLDATPVGVGSYVKCRFDVIVQWEQVA